MSWYNCICFLFKAWIRWCQKKIVASQGDYWCQLETGQKNGEITQNNVEIFPRVVLAEKKKETKCKAFLSNPLNFCFLAVIACGNANGIRVHFFQKKREEKTIYCTPKPWREKVACQNRKTVAPPVSDGADGKLPCRIGSNWRVQMTCVFWGAFGEIEPPETHHIYSYESKSLQLGRERGRQIDPITHFQFAAALNWVKYFAVKMNAHTF